jgi:hypothetical protein
MIVAILTYKVPKRLTLEQATAAFKATAPLYLRKPGLLRKHYFLTEAGDCVGGIYLWKTKADAEACYTAEWKAMVKAKYGVAPEILYAAVPVTVDNLQDAIEVA